LSSAISPKFTQDRRAALENLIFQELYRRGHHFAYYSDPDCEVDFVVHQNKQVTDLIQVSFSLLDPATRKRELKAMARAAQALHCKNLMIITWDEEGVETIDGYSVKLVLAWKWLIAENVKLR
jgi:predicted AAA+ superfamily ATPase